MPSVEVNDKVKEKLKKFKEDTGCKTLSDAINLLLYKNKVYQDKFNNGF